MILGNEVGECEGETGEKKRPVKCGTKCKNLYLRKVNSNLELWEPVWDPSQRSSS